MGTPVAKPPLLDLGHCFSEAMEVYRRNLGLLVLSAFLFDVLSFFTLFVLCGPLSGGICVLTVRALQRPDRSVDMSDLFSTFNRFGRLFALFFLTALAILPAFALCIVPGLLLATLWLFPFYFATDKDLGVFASLKASQQVVLRRGFGANLLLLVVCLALHLGPLLIPYVGSILAWFINPIAWLVATSAYLQQVHQDEAAVKDLYLQEPAEAMI